MGNDENATQVLQKALIHAPQKVALARAMVPQLAQIARGRHSHHTVLAAVQLFSEASPNEVKSKPMDRKAKLQLPGGRLERLPELLAGQRDLGASPDQIEARGADLIS
eukprot:g2673.t1